MRRPLSLAVRLTLLFGIAAAIVFPVFGLVIIQSTENHFEAQDLDELRIISNTVQAVLTAGSEGAQLSDLDQRFDDILVGHHDASLLVSAANGRVVYASQTPDLTEVAQTGRMRPDHIDVQQWTDEEHSYRALTQSVRLNKSGRSDSYTVVVAIPIDHHLRFLERFRKSLLLTVAGSVVFMGFMGWLAVYWGHAPLHDMVARIRRISTSELGTRLDSQAVPGELSELAIAFNELLQRLDEAFHRLVDFNADIAHELRTPIANLTTQTQVALSRARTVDEYRELLYSNLEEYERVAHMVSDMLFLAQADQSQQISVADVDLTIEIRALFEYFEGWADENGVTLTLTGIATVSGSRLMLQRALGNLIANAIRHAEKDTTVRVELSTSQDGETRIAIENTGPVIPPEHIPKIFDRFYRIDPSRRRGDDGVGLGLAIVASIIKLHKGTIDVASGGKLTRFTVTLQKPGHY